MLAVSVYPDILSEQTRILFNAFLWLVTSRSRGAYGTSMGRAFV